MPTRWKDYPKEVNPDLLHEELQKLPGMIEVISGCPLGVDRWAHYRMLLFEGLGVRIECDVDGLPWEEIDKVLELHDKEKKSQNQLAAEQKEAEKNAILAQVGLTREQWEKLNER